MSRQVPHAEDLATGATTAGLVPVSAGPGLPAAWSAGGGGGLSAAQPGAKARDSAGTLLPNSLPTNVLFATTVFDTSAGATMHSISSNTDRIVAPEAGLYQIDAFVQVATDFASPTAALWTVFLEIRSSVFGTHQEHHTQVRDDEGIPSASTSILAQLQAGEYVTLQLSQNSGVQLITDASAAWRNATLSVVKVG